MARSVLLKVLIVLAAIFGTHEAKKSRHERQVPGLSFDGAGPSQVVPSVHTQQTHTKTVSSTSSHIPGLSASLSHDFPFLQGIGGYQQLFGGHLSHHVLGAGGGSFGAFQSGHGAGGSPGQIVGQVDVLHGPLSHGTHFGGGFGSVGGFETTSNFGVAHVHRAAAEHHHLSRKAQAHSQIAHAAMAQADAVQNAQLQAAAAQKHLIREAMAHHTAAQHAQAAANSAQQRLLHASATRQALLQASASRAAAVPAHPVGVHNGLFGGRGLYGTRNLYSNSIHGTAAQYGGLGFEGTGGWHGAAVYRGSVPWHGGAAYHGAGPWYEGSGVHGTGAWYGTTGTHDTEALYDGAGLPGPGTFFGGGGVHGAGTLYGGTEFRGARLILPGSVGLHSGGLSHAGQHISRFDLHAAGYGHGGLYGQGTYARGTGITPLGVSQSLTIPGHSLEANYGALGVGSGHQAGGVSHGRTVSKIKKCTSIHAVHNVHGGLQQYHPVVESLRDGILGGGVHQGDLLHGGGLVTPYMSHHFAPRTVDSFAPQTSLGYGYSVGNAASGLHRAFAGLHTPVDPGHSLNNVHG